MLSPEQTFDDRDEWRLLAEELCSGQVILATVLQ